MLTLKHKASVNSQQPTAHSAPVPFIVWAAIDESSVTEQGAIACWSQLKSNVTSTSTSPVLSLSVHTSVELKQVATMPPTHIGSTSRGSVRHPPVAKQDVSQVWFVQLSQLGSGMYK